MKSKNILINMTRTSLLIALSSPAHTFGAEQDFACSAKSNLCVIKDTNVVNGDELGFFTSRGELIATGKVTKMNGEKRSVQLTQVMGPVQSKAESYAMLESQGSIRQENYKIYSQPSKLAMGASAGLSTLGAGGDAKGYEASVEGLRRKLLGQVDGFARGSFYTFSGSAQNVYGNHESGSFNATSFAATAGLSYSLFDQSDVSVRTEAGLGLAYTSAKINDSSEFAKSNDWGYGVASGFAPTLRGQITAGYKINRIQLEAGFAPGLLAGKTVNTIGAGLLVNLK